MAMTQFAMVEELASLIKDNLYSKHLILSTEEALIDSLRDDASVGGILELQPTSPYHRLLLHRLADIYGFAHESVGEGDDRHLVLQRCPETAIPSVLVSDILWQYDDNNGDFESPTSSLQMLRREDDFVVKPMMQSLTLSARLEERETAYREARNRIFALHDNNEEKDDGIVPKARKVPVVARRMIAHALGQRIPLTKFEENAVVEDNSEKSASPSGKSSSWDIKLSHESSSGSTSCDGAGSLEKGNGDAFKSSKSKSSNSIGNESNGRAAGAENMQKEQMGAAKRIFTHALRLPSGVSASTAKVNERGGALSRRET